MSTPTPGSRTIKTKKMAVEEEGLDRLSDLPDCILASSILPLLPSIKDCARTSILSSRWRNLWHFVGPLHIDAISLKPQSPNLSNDNQGNCDCGRCIDAIDGIVCHHPGPILSLRLSNVFHDRKLLNSDPFKRTLDRWIQVLTRKGIQNLSLQYKIPPLALARCPSLCSLELVQGDLREPPATMMPTNFYLRELKLKRAYMRGGGLSGLLSCCRSLDSLVLESCSILDIVRISSPCLRRLKIINIRSFDAPVVVKDAPNLELLMLDDESIFQHALEIINAPKLWGLGFVDANIEMLRFGEICVQSAVPVNLSARVHSLKALGIMVNFTDANQARTLAGLLRCFPRLETLDVMCVNAEPSVPADAGYWEGECPCDCINRHLKLVRIKGFLRHRYDLCFARFLVQHARVLQTMVVFCDFSLSEGWKAAKRRRLCLENRASPDARVIFALGCRVNSLFAAWESPCDQSTLNPSTSGPLQFL